MRSVYLAIAGAICIAVAGGYFYLDNRIESEANQILATVNADPGVPVRIHVGSLKPGIWSHSVTLSDIDIVGKAKGAKTFHAKDAILTFHSFMDIEIRIDSAEINDVHLKDRQGEVSLQKVRVTGPDLVMAYKEAQRHILDHWPLDLVEVRNLHFELRAPAPMTFNLGTYRIQTSNLGRQLDQFLIDGLAFNTSNATIGIGLRHLEIDGGDIGLVTDLIRATHDGAQTGKDFSAVEQDLAGQLARASLAYMGINRIDLQNFKIDTPQGVSMGIKALRVSDIERHDGIVTGAKAKIEDLVVNNIGKSTPQAAQFAALLDFNDFRFNMEGESHFDEKNRHLTGESHMKADGLFDIDYKMKLTDVDLNKMATTLTAMQKEQLRDAFDKTKPALPPEAAFAKSMDRILKGYTGFYSGINLQANLKDLGFMKRTLAAASVMMHRPAEALRAEAVASTLGDLKKLFGQPAPEHMDEVVTGFFAAPSTPVSIDLRNRERLTPEALSVTTRDNWQRLFKVTFAQQPSEEAATSR